MTTSTVGLIDNWYPPTRETYDLILSLWKWFPVAASLQWGVSWYGMGKTSVTSRLNLPGRIGWLTMEAPGFMTLVYMMRTLPAQHGFTLSDLPWQNKVLAGLFVFHYSYRALAFPFLQPSMAPIHIAIWLSALSFQIINGTLIGAWLAAYGPTTHAAWDRQLFSSFPTLQFTCGIALFYVGLMANFYHDDELREIRRRENRRQERLAKQNGQKGQPGKKVEKHYEIPKAGLFKVMLYPHYFCEWVEWLGFYMAAGWGCLPARCFLLNEVAAMLPRAVKGKQWYMEKFGEEKISKKWAVIPGVCTCDSILTDIRRPHQREIIEAALDGHDVFVQAATSFGKSLCFQLPAVIDRGITIVISPLLSLMMNQVEALKASDVDARTLNSNTTLPERDYIYADLATGHPLMRLLYVTPELCSGDHFRRKLKLVYEQHELARIVVDEAHCISEWGHDFRKDFKRLSWFRETFPDVPVMCLTATANEQVRHDVLTTLGLDKTPGKLKIFSMTAHRPNLHLEVRFTSDEANDRYDDFVTWLKGVYDRRAAADRKAELDATGERVENVPGIIYTISRDEVESLAAALRHDGIGARPFHAKLPNQVKEETLAKWIANDPGYDVIVATTAFGMGIDKENVRFVVHWRLPKSFEGYYQEAGRAGRDGNASYCFLYYSREDRDRVCNLVMREPVSKNASADGIINKQARQMSLGRLVAYCEDTGSCRHAAICRYFGETQVPACDYACDWHKDPQGLKRRMARGLASEEWVSTQREEGMYDEYWSE
ncbi:ATP-dependent DNA helicase [Neurospora hispaniola]|uniref:ATP-dependent DNA helicase n=1 Tax=Neurospora hispaniola TaxID=588809 RepID=A0AAJ0MQ21_9PEZI|nr:ATP-dependent DNA helicase [Neurospora hispaniola]